MAKSSRIDSVKMRYAIVRRGLATAISAVVIAVGLVAGSAPVSAHPNTCSLGSSNYVVVVFAGPDWTGLNDDICWLSTFNHDPNFGTNSANVDDIGENGNLDNTIESVSIKNFGGSNLCVRWYYGPNLTDPAEWTWVPAGYGDHHLHLLSQSYSSLDLLFTSTQAACSAF